MFSVTWRSADPPANVGHSVTCRSADPPANVGGDHRPMGSWPFPEQFGVSLSSGQPVMVHRTAQVTGSLAHRGDKCFRSLSPGFDDISHPSPQSLSKTTVGWLHCALKGWVCSAGVDTRNEDNSSSRESRESPFWKEWPPGRPSGGSERTDRDRDGTAASGVWWWFGGWWFTAVSMWPVGTSACSGLTGCRWSESSLKARCCRSLGWMSSLSDSSRQRNEQLAAPAVGSIGGS